MSVPNSNIVRKKRKKPVKKSERQKKGILYTDLSKIDTKEYVDNDVFYQEMVKSKELGQFTPLALDCYLLLAAKASRSFPYSDPMDREDCISGAHHDFLRYGLKNFKPERKNAVAYFSTIAFNAFMKSWNELKPKKQKFIKYVVTYMGETRYLTYNEEEALEYYQDLRNFHSKNKEFEHVKLESFTVSKNISIDGFIDDSESGIYNI